LKVQVGLDYRGLRVHKEQEELGIRGFREIKEFREPMVYREIKEFRELSVYRELKEMRVC
jgi:hypothetical protein